MKTVCLFVLFFLQVSMMVKVNHCQNTMQKSLDLMNGYANNFKDNIPFGFSCKNMAQYSVFCGEGSSA